MLRRTCILARHVPHIRLLRLPVTHFPVNHAGTFVKLYSTGTTMSSLITDTLLPKCSSCGVLLQSESKDSPGFFLDVQSAKVHVKKDDKTHNALLSLLSEEDRILLLNGASESVPDAGSEIGKLRKAQKQAKTLQNTKVQCTRCRDALFRSQFVAGQYNPDTVSQVMETIPPYANLVYVISALDFPMSLDPEVFKYRSAQSMQFVITKSDLLFATNALAGKYGLQFFQDYLWRMHQVPSSNVFCVSGQVDWSTDLVYKGIQDNSYFIGKVNSGKSTLILSLLHVAQKHRDNLPNARREVKLQKLQDNLLVHGKKPTNRQALIKYNLAATKAFKQVHGPGTSYMPGFTRGILPFELSRTVTVYDVPGFSAISTELSDIIAPENVKKLCKGQKLHRAGTYKSHYDTVKGGQIYTVGGLFMLQVPCDAMLQVRNMINHELHVFGNIDKAMHVWNNREQYPALRDVYVMNATTPMRKWIIPSFYGMVDLVIGTFGYISIKPTGSFGADPFVVYVPEGIEVIIRQPITDYVTRTLAGRDKKGNVLRKEKWAALSVTEVKRYTGKTPFFSRLVPMGDANASELDTKANAIANASLADVMHHYIESVKGSAVAHDQISPATKYANWI